MKIRFIPDTPISSTSEDLLGHKILSNSICETLEYTEAPFVFGLIGDWGTGKTSILRLVYEKLLSHNTSDKIFIPIWFNAWEYENEDNVALPMLYSIYSNYQNKFQPSEIVKHKFFKVVSTATLALTDIGFRAATKLLVGDSYSLEDITKLYERYSQQLDDTNNPLINWADNIGKINKDFSEFLTTYAEAVTKGHKNEKKQQVCFVLIIDDLDRCIPSTAIRILENIKNYFSVNKIIYLIGINSRVINQGVTDKFNGGSIDGKEYLEKILNFSFYVPAPKNENISEYTIQLLRNLIVDDEDHEKLLSYFRAFGSILNECNFNNPRKIKRALNSYLLFLNNHKDDLFEFHHGTIVKLLLIAEYYPNLYNAILQDPLGVSSSLINIGTDKFEKSVFEKKYGINLSHTFEHLIKVKNLFNLAVPKGANQEFLRKHLVAIANFNSKYTNFQQNPT